MATTIEATVLDDALDRLVGRRGIRHAVVAVEHGDGAPGAVAAGGVAAPDGEVMHPDVPFHFASVTKLYTATVVLQLWEQERLDLDTTIGALLPAALVDGIHRIDGVDRSAAITVRHLLSHTSGLPDYFLEAPTGRPSFADRIVEGDFAYTVEDVAAQVRRLPAHFPPQDFSAARQRARYCDTNFQLLGAVVATVTGQPLPQVVEQQILEPLHLDDTWFAGHPRVETPRVPAAMWSGDTVLDRPQAMASMAPEGGLIGTAGDALAFLRALRAGSVFHRETTRAHMVARWNRFPIPRDRTSIMAPSWPIEYGLGIKRFRVPWLLRAGRRSPTLLGHTGANGSWLFWCEEHDLCLAGTVDQTTAAAVPYRLVPQLARRLAGSAA